MLKKYILSSKKNLLPFILIILLFVNNNSNLLYSKGIEASLTSIIRNNNLSVQDKLISAFIINNSKLTSDSLIGLIKSVENRELKFASEKNKKRGLLFLENLCTDSVYRKYCLYIPKSYDDKNSTTLIVYLHGGVSRKELLTDDDAKEFFNEIEYTRLADREGYIVLYPFGQKGATWWDELGIENVFSQINETKRNYNINNNKVFLTGFSDGASGSFSIAMTLPNKFAGFIPLNGHPAVGHGAGNIDTYLSNLYNRKLFIINTDIDGLYPDKKIRPIIKYAQELGGDILYKVYNGIGHRPDYFPDEIDRINNFIKTTTRNTVPNKINWRSSTEKYGNCDWLTIVSVDTILEREKWHKEENIEMIDDRIRFGFYSDREYTGTGIKIDKIAGENSLCAKLKMMDGDIIIGLNDSVMNEMKDMVVFKKTIKRSDKISFTVKRGEETLILKGKLPEITMDNLFNRDKESAIVAASFIANTFYLKSSKLEGFKILLHPEMIQSDQSIKVYNNDQLIFDEIVKPDFEFMLRNYLKNMDSDLLYIKAIPLN